MIALIEAGNTASRYLHERYGFSTVGTIPQAGQTLGQILDLTLMSRSLKGPTMHSNQNPVCNSRFRQVGATEPIQLQPEEPAVTQWQVSAIADLVTHLLSLVGDPEGRNGSDRKSVV